MSSATGAYSVRVLAIALPLVFAVHVAEEAPGFVAWFNALVTPGITRRSFLSVNATAFLITLAVSTLVPMYLHGYLIVFRGSRLF
jgi:hypothetical protein